MTRARDLADYIAQGVSTTELDILDGLTTTTAELNIMDGVTSTTAELNILDGVTSTAAELNILDGVTATATELNLIDGVTSTTDELNILDGVTSTTAELNYNDTGAAVGTVVASKTVTVDANKDASSFRNITMAGDLSIGGDVITASNATLDLAPNGTGTVVVRGNTNSGAIVFNCESNSHGQKVYGQPHSATVTNTLMLPAGANSTLLSRVSVDTLTNKTLTSPKVNEDVAVTSTATELNLLDGVTATTAELNILDGVTSTAAELNILDGVTSTAAELNILDGVTATATELNLIDGVTATTAELNILDGVTSTAAELNILDGVTSTAAELNILDGVTATAAELNYLDLATLGTSAASKVVTSDANNVVTFSGGISEDSVTISSSSNAATINLREGTSFLHDLTENVTYTFSNPAASGNSSIFTLKIIQGSSARAITWPSSVDWAAATAPTLTATDNGVDIFVFQTIDGGTTYYGFVAGQAFG